MGFIRSEKVKFTHTPPEQEHEDELSITMLAFCRAIFGYEKGKGAFLPYAARAIKNRLIDHYRVEKRHRNIISLHTPTGAEEDRQLLDTLPEQRDAISEHPLAGKSRDTATGELMDRAIEMGFLSSGDTISITENSEASQTSAAPTLTQGTVPHHVGTVLLSVNPEIEMSYDKAINAGGYLNTTIDGQKRNIALKLERALNILVTAF